MDSLNQENHLHDTENGHSKQLSNAQLEEKEELEEEIDTLDNKIRKIDLIL